MITHDILELSSLERSLLHLKLFEGFVYKFKGKKTRMCVEFKVIMVRSLKTQCLHSFSNPKEYFMNFLL